LVCCFPLALTVCARIDVGHPQATSTPVASTSAPAACGAGDGKKQRLGDSKSGKPAKTLKLKLIKAPGACGGKNASVADSSKATGISNSGVAPTAVEGKKKKKKSKKSKAGSADAAAAPTPAAKAKPTDTSAIDDLFASLKTAKQEQARADEQKKRDETKAAQRAQQEKQQLQAHIKKLEAQSACRSSLEGSFVAGC